MKWHKTKKWGGFNVHIYHYFGGREKKGKENKLRDINIVDTQGLKFSCQYNLAADSSFQGRETNSALVQRHCGDIWRI